MFFLFCFFYYFLNFFLPFFNTDFLFCILFCKILKPEMLPAQKKNQLQFRKSAYTPHKQADSNGCYKYLYWEWGQHIYVQQQNNKTKLEEVISLVTAPLCDNSTTRKIHLFAIPTLHCLTFWTNYTNVSSLAFMIWERNSFENIFKKDQWRSEWVIHHVKQPVSVRSRFCRRKAILALLDQLTSFGQRESLTIHASSDSGRMSAVSSAQSVNMLQSVAARWRWTKWLGNRKFPGSHPSNYLWSQTLLNINDYMKGTLSKAI